MTHSGTETLVAGHPLLQDEFVLEIDNDQLPSFRVDDGSCLMLPAAIDCGTAMTKIVHLTNSTSTKTDRRLMHFALFESKHLDAALDWLSERLDKNEEGQQERKLRVTGAGVGQHGDRMKERLGVDLEVMDESASQCHGFHFLLTHYPNLADFCHPAPAIDETEFAGMQRGETFQKICDSQAEMMGEQQSQDVRFPCMLAVYGSTASVFLIREDGSTEEKYYNQMAGKSFLGACQLLIGTSDYSEILRLAVAGMRGNIDSQVRDLMDDVPDSPYGLMPLSMPLFTFGKAVDFDKSLEDTSREDVAQSLVSSFTANLAYPVSQMAGLDGVGNVYFGGYFFRHEFARAEVIRSTKFFSATDKMNLNFLKIGPIAALGAILSMAPKN